jgi:class 3 adenylate cyclase
MTLTDANIELVEGRSIYSKRDGTAQNYASDQIIEISPNKEEVLSLDAADSAVKSFASMISTNESEALEANPAAFQSASSLENNLDNECNPFTLQFKNPEVEMQFCYYSGYKNDNDTFKLFQILVTFYCLPYLIFVLTLSPIDVRFLLVRSLLVIITVGLSLLRHRYKCAGFNQKCLLSMALTIYFTEHVDAFTMGNNQNYISLSILVILLGCYSNLHLYFYRKVIVFILTFPLRWISTALLYNSVVSFSSTSFTRQQSIPAFNYSLLTILLNEAVLVVLALFVLVLSNQMEKRERKEFWNRNLMVETRENCNDLLKRMLPRHIIQQIKLGHNNINEVHSSVSILFSEIANFQAVVRNVSPVYLVGLLDRLFSQFDQISDTYGMYKVETMRDQYILAAGLDWTKDAGEGSHRSIIEQTYKLALCALEMIRAARAIEASVNEELKAEQQRLIREYRQRKAKQFANKFGVGGHNTSEGEEDRERANSNHSHIDGNSRCQQRYPIFSKSARQAIFRAHLGSSRNSSPRIAGLNINQLLLPLQLRIGLHTGELIAGVIGQILPKYKLYGETINTAARLAHDAEAGRIQLSNSADKILLKCNLTPKLGTTQKQCKEIMGIGTTTTSYLQLVDWDDAEFNIAEEQPNLKTKQRIHHALNQIDAGQDIRATIQIKNTLGAEPPLSQSSSTSSILGIRNPYQSFPQLLHRAQQLSILDPHPAIKNLPAFSKPKAIHRNNDAAQLRSSALKRASSCQRKLSPLAPIQSEDEVNNANHQSTSSASSSSSRRRTGNSPVFPQNAPRSQDAADITPISGNRRLPAAQSARIEPINLLGSNKKKQLRQMASAAAVLISTDSAGLPLSPLELDDEANYSINDYLPPKMQETGAMKHISMSRAATPRIHQDLPQQQQQNRQKPQPAQRTRKAKLISASSASRSPSVSSTGHQSPVLIIRPHEAPKQLYNHASSSVINSTSEQTNAAQQNTTSILYSPSNIPAPVPEESESFYLEHKDRSSLSVASPLSLPPAALYGQSTSSSDALLLVNSNSNTVNHKIRCGESEYVYRLGALPGITILDLQQLDEALAEQQRARELLRVSNSKAKKVRSKANHYSDLLNIDNERVVVQAEPEENKKLTAPSQPYEYSASSTVADDESSSLQQEVELEGVTTNHSDDARAAAIYHPFHQIHPECISFRLFDLKFIDFLPLEHRFQQQEQKKILTFVQPKLLAAIFIYALISLVEFLVDLAIDNSTENRNRFIVRCSVGAVPALLLLYLAGYLYRNLLADLASDKQNNKSRRSRRKALIEAHNSAATYRNLVLCSLIFLLLGLLLGDIQLFSPSVSTLFLMLILCGMNAVLFRVPYLLSLGFGVITIIFFLICYLIYPLTSNHQAQLNSALIYQFLGMLLAILVIFGTKSRMLETRLRIRFITKEQIKKQRNDTKNLIDALLPQPIIKQVLNNFDAQSSSDLYVSLPKAISVSYPQVTLFEGDICSFSSLCARSGSDQIIALLNKLFTMFDELCAKHCVYKVDTIGDSILCSSGAPYSHPHHASALSVLALEARSILDHDSNRGVIAMRFGLHTGPVVAAVSQLFTFPRYTLYGETVNITHTIQQHSSSNMISISAATKACIDQFFNTEFIGPVAVDEEGGYINRYNLVNKKP